MRCSTSPKPLLAALSMAVGSLAVAGGPADGAYFCTLSIAGLGSVQQYAVITGKPDGTSVVVFPATQPSHLVYGYGVGFAGGGRFNGTSDRGQPFSLSYTASSVTGFFGYALIGGPVPANASCSRVF